MSDLDAPAAGATPVAVPPVGTGRAFVKEIGATVATRGATIVLGVVSSVLINRALGPSGRGDLAVATVAATVLSTVGTLGMQAANTYEVGRDRTLLPTLLGNSFALAGIAGVASAVVVAIVHEGRPGALPLAVSFLVLVVVAVPVGVASTLVQQLLVATGRVGVFNQVELGQRLVLLAVLAVVLVTDTASAGAVFAGTLVAGAVTLGYATWRLRDPILGRVTTAWSAFRSSLGYSMRGFVASLASLLVIRIDILILREISGVRETGLYAAAVAVGDLLLMVPTVTGLLLFPRLVAAAPAPRDSLAVRTVGLVAGGMALLLAVSWPFFEVGLRALYGPEFVGSADPLRALVPGIFALSVATIVNNYLASVGMPASTLVGPILAIVVNVSANLLLTPSLGARGAAFASSLAYVVMLLSAAVAAVRASRRGRPR